MPRRRYYNNTSFLDLLFNTLVGFVLLFIVAFLSINVQSRKADIETKAEFVISVSWEDNSADDVDTWLEDPAGNILFFKQKDIGLAHLDRDDLGKVNDRIIADGKTIEYIYNQELTTIRGFIGGEWVLNLHMYNKRDSDPVTVTVRIDKLNPRVETLFLKEFIMDETGQELTATRFVMSDQGSILEWNELPKSLLSLETMESVESEPRIY
jgi:hypothetical protein